jgi:hypothetical protein
MGDPDGDEFYFSIEGAVIAWRIDLQKYGSRAPITVEQDEDEHAFVILCPDGKIIDQTYACRCFANIEAWGASARKQWAERRARHIEEANCKAQA